MRILLVTPIYVPSLAGAAVYFDTLARALRTADPTLAITVLTTRRPDAPATERSGGATVVRALPPADAGRRAALATAARIAGWSWRRRSDIVHFHTLVAYRALHAAAPFVHGRLVGDMRDLAARDEGADVRYYARCARIICAAENIADYLRAAGVAPERLAAIPVPLAPLPVPSAADVAAARTRHALGEEPYLLFLGNVVPAKGVPALLDAMPAVWRHAPALRLVLAGARHRGAHAAFDARLDALLAADDRVRWLGPVGRADVPALLRGAAAFVLPSPSEGLPRSCLEALSLGVRVVLPPGVPEFARACPEAVLPRVAPDAIAAGVVRALAAPPARYPLERHDAGAVARRTLALYHEVLAGPGAGRGRNSRG